MTDNIIVGNCRKCGPLTRDKAQMYSNRVRCDACCKRRAKETRLRNPQKYGKQVTVERDPLTMEIRCSTCKQTKDITLFGNKEFNRAYPSCKSCSKQQSARYRSTRSDIILSAERSRKYMRAYGITLDQYRAIESAQNGVCEICKGLQTYKNKDGYKQLHVDHCHETGKVRALLCNKCNVGIGAFDETPEKLQAAIDYLKKHS